MLEQVTRLLYEADENIIKQQLIMRDNTSREYNKEQACRDLKYYRGQQLAYEKVLDLLSGEAISKSFKDEHIDFIKSEDC